MVVDGTTQPSVGGQSRITLLGAGVVEGITFPSGSSGSVLRGLTLRRFYTAVKLLEATDVLIGGAGAGNVIGGCITGIYAAGSHRLRVEGNLIGTDAVGSGGLHNATGVYIINTQNATVGGTAPGVGNVIANSSQEGLELNFTAHMRVQGNYIGTDVTGSAAQGNSTGIYVAYSTDVQLGGADLGARNVISANGWGVYLWTTNDSRVEGNYIGTDAAGSRALGNDAGLVVQDCGAPVVGGVAPGAGNVISGNTGTGIVLQGLTTGVQVAGNRIGTDASGTSPLGNYIGVYLIDSASGVIGGTAPGSANVIADCFYGIDILDAEAVQIEGNFIGTDFTQTYALGNFTGMEIGNGHNVTVGGTEPGAPNVIAFNMGPAVGLYPAGNRVQQNSIYGNYGLAIDYHLDGITPNDNPDVDEVPNFPILVSATPNGGGITVTGVMHGIPSTGYALELYSNPQPDATGYGQGQNYLGMVTVNTNSSGNAEFFVTLPGAVPVGYAVSATATSAAGTSEFSPDVLVAPEASISGYVYQDHEGDGSQGSDDEGLSGRTVQATNTGTSASYSATTDAAGHYGFPGLEPGNYRVRLVSRPGWSQTSADPADIAFTSTPVSAVSFGVFQQVTISGTVYDDVYLYHSDIGVRLSGWQVQLVNAADQSVLASTVTDAAGHYYFLDVAPATGTPGPLSLRVTVTAMPHWLFTTTAPAAIPLRSGPDPVTDVDFGFFHTVHLAGSVVHYNIGHSPVPLPNVTVTVTGGAAPRTVQTSADGTYLLEDVGPGTYTLAASGGGATYTAAFADPPQITVQNDVDNFEFLDFAGGHLPMAAADGYSVNASTALAVSSPGVLANDSDADGDTLETHLVDQPLHGTVILDFNGSFLYVPLVGYSGPDSFTYEARDYDGTSQPATVTLNVGGLPASTRGKVTANGAATASFAITASYDRQHGLKATLLFTDTVKHTVVKGKHFTALVITGNHARLYGKATVNGHGNYDFVVDLDDLANPGRNIDRFGIQVSSGYSLGPSYLTRGDIKVQ